LVETVLSAILSIEKGGYLKNIMTRLKIPVFLIPFIFLFSFSAIFAQPSSYRRIAKYIAEKAYKANKTKVAVLVYVPLGGK
jgi:uncharacterized membrane protein